ncbi:acyl-CoA carboxylase epsilon subunit [Streptomyces sp. NPDC059697]|uniref:acyl-CoA carboxylase epsilon subunit n=1 Tax=Streptomyces sp. NPDC059697 TaxID=3346912 RepID=UPI0036C3684D
MMTKSHDPRWLRVERGNPSPEELAALVAVLLARTADGAAASARAEPVPAIRWRRPERAFLYDAPRVWRAYERVAA